MGYILIVLFFNKKTEITWTDKLKRHNDNSYKSKFKQTTLFDT